jgi:hypothetical protein
VARPNAVSNQCNFTSISTGIVVAVPISFNSDQLPFLLAPMPLKKRKLEVEYDIDKIMESVRRYEDIAKEIIHFQADDTDVLTMAATELFLGDTIRAFRLQSSAAIWTTGLSRISKRPKAMNRPHVFVLRFLIQTSGDD